MKPVEIVRLDPLTSITLTGGGPWLLGESVSVAIIAADDDDDEAPELDEVAEWRCE